MRILSLKHTAQSIARLVVPFAVKAEDVDADARTFEGLAAVWDLDLGGDVIHKGAFKNTLAAWKKSQDAIPLLNSHEHFDIFGAVGQLLDAKETAEGLWTKWEVINGQDGDRVMDRIRPSARTNRPVIGKMSIGYEALKFDFEQDEGDSIFDRIRNLHEVSLKEVSLVMFPMAPNARIDATTVKQFLTSAKATDPKVLDDATREGLRRLASRIGVLLSSKTKKEEAPAPAAPAAPASAPPVIPAAEPVTPAPDDAEDDADTDEVIPPTPEPSAPVVPEPPAAPESTEKQEPVYLFAEALQQRVQRNLLQARLSSHKEKQS